MEGVLQSRPAFPRYHSIWDVSIVFDYMKALPPVSDRVKDLSMSLTFLLFITSAQRCQTVKSLSLNDMHFSDQSYKFQISTKMEQTRPNKHIPPVCFKSYPHDPKL